MSFAPEPLLDAFTPPPAARATPRALAADDGGQTFEYHLEAVDEPAPDRAAPARNEAKDETARAPVEAQPAQSEDAPAADESLDVEAALLGGPLPPTPPPMAAPVVVQIVASQPQQQAPAPDGEGETAPVSALPEAPIAAPAPAETGALAAQAAPGVVAKDKQAPVEAKPAAPDAPQPQATPQTTNDQAAQAQPTTPQRPAAKPVTAAELPTEVQQALAATIAPAPQTTVTPATRAAKAVAPTDEAKAAPTAPDGKPEAPAPNTGVRGNAPKASNNGGGVVIDAAAAATPQPLSAAPDGAQIAQSNAVTTTASQASTHVQQTAVDTGAQRAAPASQVGREIIRRFDGGNTSFELRLDPAELGRVEVRMEVTRDHRVTAVITADNPQALTELARHSRELEQQLQSAGLQLGENGLSFDLRQGSQGDDARDANANARGGNGEEALSEQQPAQVARPIGYERWRGVRVDMRV